MILNFRFFSEAKKHASLVVSKWGFQKVTHEDPDLREYLQENGDYIASMKFAKNSSQNSRAMKEARIRYTRLF